MLRFQPDAQKSNKAQLLPMTPEFAELLQTVPESERTGYVFNPLPINPGIARAARPGLTRVKTLICEMGERAGVKVSQRGDKSKYASAHDFRRAFGFRWSLRIMPAHLQQLMRHEDIKTTMTFYVGRDAEVAADALWQALPKADLNDPANTFAGSGSKSFDSDKEKTASS